MKRHVAPRTNQTLACAAILLGATGACTVETVAVTPESDQLASTSQALDCGSPPDAIYTVSTALPIEFAGCIEEQRTQHIWGAEGSCGSTYAIGSAAALMANARYDASVEWLDIYEPNNAQDCANAHAMVEFWGKKCTGGSCRSGIEWESHFAEAIGAWNPSTGTCNIKASLTTGVQPYLEVRLRTRGYKMVRGAEAMPVKLKFRAWNTSGCIGWP